MRPHLTIPGKLAPGDKVAVVSPSFAAPGPFPEVHELAMTRLREDIELEPVEYPTTRQLGAAPQARADDLMAAFADPDIKAVLATIGGDDQITVLPFLDPGVVTANPKAYFGYSDNTNLLNWLWYHGIAGYHGGSTMVHLGRPGGLHPVSTASLRAALLDGGDLRLCPVDRFCEVELSWADPEGLRYPAPTSPAPGWVWHRPGRVVTGPTWGGNLEILQWTLAVGRWIRPAEDYAGCVLILETSEEMPLGRGGVPDAAQHGRARAARPVPRRGVRHRQGDQHRPAGQPGQAGAVPDRAARCRAGGVRGLQSRGDDRLQRGHRPHRPTVGASLRWHDDRRRPGPHDHRVVLAAAEVFCSEVCEYPKELLDPAALHSDLAQYGIPAKVTSGSFCSSDPHPACFAGRVDAAGRAVHHDAAIRWAAPITIDPSAMPAGAELSFGYFQLSSGPAAGEQQADVVLIDTSSYTCTSAPPDPSGPPAGDGESDSFGLLYGGPGPSGS